MNGHTCTCLACRPELYPPEHRSERRTADRHFAIRWQMDQTMRVFVDGVRQVECDEAMAGVDGWAIVATYDETGRVHYCECGSWHICRRVMRGHVQVGISRPGAH